MISIIVPVYNAQNYITETIESVRNETYTDWEMILVLDGCSDNTKQVIREFCEKTGDERINMIVVPDNMGVAAARNTGLSQAHGRYIAYLDADDLWQPHKLEKQLAFMEENDAAFSFTGYEFADETGKGTGKIVHVPDRMNYTDALKNTTIFTTTVMFDTQKTGKELLQMSSVKSEDTALWWKVLRNGFTAYGLNENLAMYRRMGTSLSSNKAEAARRIWNLYRRNEHLSVLKSAWYFCFWAVRALKRRI